MGFNLGLIGLPEMGSREYYGIAKDEYRSTNEPKGPIPEFSPTPTQSTPTKVSELARKKLVQGIAAGGSQSTGQAEAYVYKGGYQEPEG